MAALSITREEYLDRVHGSLLGKSVGITLAAPVQRQLIPGRLNFYLHQPGQPTAHHGFDFTVAWLQALDKRGVDLDAEDLAEIWLDHLDYNQDEFGYAILNLRRGLPPPASGAHSNWFRTSSGAFSRADFWALMYPGNPQAAAAAACKDASLDHCEDGVWAPMFLAAIGSAAFFLTDPLTLLTIGLAMIPRTCRTARAVKAALAAVQRGAGWFEAREAVQHEVGTKNPSDVPQLAGFFTLGLFYGNREFGASLCAGINCGYDAMAVGAALGSVLGIQRGATGLPIEWTEPLHDLYIAGPGIRNLKLPQSLAEIAERIVFHGLSATAKSCPDLEILVAPAEPVLPETDAPPMAPETPVGVPADLVMALTTVPEPAHLVPEELEPAVRPLTPEELPEPPVYLAPEPVQVPEPQFLLSDAPVPEDVPAPRRGLIEEAPLAAAAESPTDLIETLKPQPVSVETADLTGPDIQGVSGEVPLEPAVAPDPVSAIAWADSTLVKPLLVTPPNSFTSCAGEIEVLMDAGSTPTVAFNDVKPLSFTLRNHGAAPFSGRIVLLAPPGWQVSTPSGIGQRQYIAPGSGALRVEFGLRVPHGAGRIEIANAVTLRLIPDSGGPAMDAEFLLLGASCWYAVGPFPNYDGEGFDRKYAPEDRPGLAETYVTRISNSSRWEPISFAESHMDLEPVFKGSSGVCYGRTVLNSRLAREARIGCATNCGVKIWLNGALVFRRMYREPYYPVLGAGPWCADVNLQAGENQLLVKWIRSSEPYEFSLTIADRFGRGLPDVGATSW
jgi:ADP-ribosylglycohydrolase